MRKLFRVLCFTLLLLLPGACQPQENELSFETIDQEDSNLWGQYEGREPNLMVLTEPDEVAALYQVAPRPAQIEFEDTGETRPYPEWRLQDMDWEAYFVVIAFQGLKATAGYGVTIQRITQQGQRINVYAQFKEPKPEEVVHEVQTSPVHVVQVKKEKHIVGKEFRFYLIVDGAPVAYQDYFIHKPDHSEHRR